MFCAHCGTENASGIEACDRCGEPLIVPDIDQRQPQDVKTCPGCAAHNEAHARFCIGCGNELEGVPALATPAEASRPETTGTTTPEDQPVPPRMADRGDAPPLFIVYSSAVGSQWCGFTVRPTGRLSPGRDG